MNIGLTSSEITMIINVITQSGVTKAVVFGSRAKGTWANNSDIDIAIFGSNINIGHLRLSLDELPIPYKFDIVDYEKTTHIPLREHIDRLGVVIYEKNT